MDINDNQIDMECDRSAPGAVRRDILRSSDPEPLRQGKEVVTLIQPRLPSMANRWPKFVHDIDAYLPPLHSEYYWAHLRRWLLVPTSDRRK